MINFKQFCLGALALAFVSGAEAQVNLESGLIHHYKLDNNTADSVGSANAFSSNITATTDRFGEPNSAYAFNGQDSYIETAPGSMTFSSNGFGDFAFTGWFQEASGADLQASDVLLRYAAQSGMNQQTYASVSLNAAGNPDDMTFNHGETGGPGFGIPTYTSDMGIGGWHLIVAQRVGNTIELYYDGTQVGTGSGTAAGMNGNELYFAIGGLAGSPNSFEGDIDDIRIYDRSLNQQEIDSLFNYEPSVVSIEKTTQQSIEFEAFPNPANDFLTLQFPVISDYQIQLIDLQGKVLLETRGNSASINLDLSQYAAGHYFIQIIDGENSVSRKILKQ